MTRDFKERKPRGLRDARVRLAVAIIALTIAGVFFFLEYLPSNQYSGGLVIDWRVKLHILDVRYMTNSTPPAGIGVPGGRYWYNHTYDSVNGVWVGSPGYAPLNTRDDSGTIYVQSTHCCPAYIFTLGYFFSEWGKPLSKSCVLSYCTSPGETIVYDNDSNGMYSTPDRVIYAAGNNIPPLGTLLSSDSNLKYVDSDGNSRWDPGETVVYDSNSNGQYDAGDAIAQSGTSNISLGSTLSSDPKINYVESNGDSTYDLRQPPPVMSDGKDPERCVSPLIGLSNGYDWIIITWSSLSSTISGNCLLP
ncbi:hypothetical protein E6H35_09275 [Candidatus Bathyarchaeota archaeon]|nr:MAG: hypothetical protein E6H35_09275 [Candidatus Bathyarchaeota archaeon]